MSEAIEDNYTTLVKEVYIDPIRTVVVVDDDFPTLDGLLDSANSPEIRTLKQDDSEKIETATPATEETQLKPSGSTEQTVAMHFSGQISEVERVKELISLCRSRTKPWMVDVHDGRPGTGMDELALAPSLHHSDLMILDYHLNGDGGDGERAIQILKKLAENDQFNLVVVYTKGIAGDIEEVYRQIAVALASREWQRPSSAAKLLATQELIRDWEGVPDHEGVEGDLLSLISITNYLRIRTRSLCLESAGLKEVFEAFLKKCPSPVADKLVNYKAEDGREQRTKLSEKSLFEYALHLRHEERNGHMSEINYGDIACDFNEEHNWIRFDKIFITVINKITQAPKNIEARLVDALKLWAPGPHRLLMARMRTKLSEKGVSAEGAVLANKPLQAGWLHELLDSNSNADAVMTQSINRHWEALGDRIYPDVKRYAESVYGYFRNAERDQVLARYMPADVNEEERLAQLNHYYSTKPIDSTHLTTGQVFAFEQIEPDGQSQKFEYWICLSPACDLVPGQKNSGWKSRLGHAMPFIAVQLEKTKRGDALANINQNRFVLAQIDNSIAALKFTDAPSTSLPMWEQMFALECGNFSIDPQTEQRSLEIQRMYENSGKLAFSSSKAIVVSQLRYEYALNLLHRLASALSRVGLDFRSL